MVSRMVVTLRHCFTKHITMKNRKLSLVIGFAVAMTATITALSIAPAFIFISLPAALVCGAMLNK